MPTSTYHDPVPTTPDRAPMKLIDAAEYAGLTPRELMAALDAGRIAAVTIGGRIAFTVDQLDALRAVN